MSRGTRSKNYLGQLELPFEEEKKMAEVDPEILQEMGFKHIEDVENEPPADRCEPPKGSNRREKVPLQERFDAQKRCLQRMVVAAFQAGSMNGLPAEGVRSLQASLVVLGWLPDDLRL